jgi:hypothetical protein
MLNPLSKHRSSQLNDLPGEDGNDLEGSITSREAPGYIGKILIS